MDLREAVEKAHRILFQEQTKSTRQYKYAKETGLTPGLTNESLYTSSADYMSKSTLKLSTD